MALLAPDEPPPFEIVNLDGASPYLLTCDHASAAMPRALGDLGVVPDDRLKHAAWDIGAAVMARRMAELLDAPLILSGYSRLVIDLNRPPGSPSSIPPKSELVEAPGNADLSPEDALARAEALFWPYHRALARLLARRLERPRTPLYVAVHSYTPVYFGTPRPMEVCISWRRDPRLGRALLAGMQAAAVLKVAANDPFEITLHGDFGIPCQAERLGVPCALLEVRQDRIERDLNARAWGERLAEVLHTIQDRPELADRLSPPDDLPHWPQLDD